MACIGRDTHTLVHTDAHLGQMFFPTEQFSRFVLFDWQFPSKAWAAEDAIHAIVCDLDIDVRQQHESALLDHYYNTLRQQGVSDLTRERFDFQCRLSLIWIAYVFFNLLAQPDMTKTLNAEMEAAGENLRDWILEPLEVVTADWNLADALDQAIHEANILKM